MGFATQSSISPPRFIVCLSEKNRTYRIATRTDHLGVHVLAGGQDRLAALFGGETGDEVAARALFAEHGEHVRPFPFRRAQRIEAGHGA